MASRPRRYNRECRAPAAAQTVTSPVNNKTGTVSHLLRLSEKEISLFVFTIGKVNRAKFLTFACAPMKNHKALEQPPQEDTV